MKFTFSWLKDYLDTKLDIYQIANILTGIGLEVENIQDKSKVLAPFTVAYVKNVEKHPNADRLKICQVETKKGVFQVVCGAPNARVGMKGIFAPKGSFIPGSGITLQEAHIREIKSVGMLLSEREMGLSDNHEEIIEVDNSYKIGEPSAKIFGLEDPIIEIGITPNRGDCLSVKGIARDLAAAGAGKLKSTKIRSNPGTFKSPIIWKRSFKKNNEKLCSIVAGRYFKNVSNGNSPEWLKKRLLAIGLRPISTLVDITNYITFDLGRPLHVFDADKINGNLTMRLAKNNEMAKVLDGKTYKLKENMVVIADNNQVHAIGGVMGGEDSSCTESTSNVFLEVALFDPISVSRTGRELNLKSDARFRFERGVDPDSIKWGIDIATKMILDLCGGETSKITIAGNKKIPDKFVKYNFDKVFSLGGIKVNKKIQMEILDKLGFKLSKNKGNQCIIKVPSFRPDVDGEADIVEEILRIFGYEKIEPISVIKEKTDISKTLSLNQSSFYKSKRLMASRGYMEVVTWSFMSSKFVNYFNQYNNVIKLDNPISTDLDIMRPSIIPNLLESVNKNQSRFFHTAGLFEVGPQYENLRPEGQHTVAVGIKYGNINNSNWNDEERSVDVFDIKADMYFLLSQLGVRTDSLQLDYNAPGWYHPGKSATLRLGKKTLGYFGEINPVVLNIYDITSSVCGFEILLNQLQQFQTMKHLSKKSYHDNPYQAVERDFAFIVDKNIKSSQITDIVKKTEKELIKEIKIFDVYEGKNIPEGKKSIAIRIILQPQDSTFKDQDIEVISKKIVEKVNIATGGEIRK